jgi:hypothetical protein
MIKFWEIGCLRSSFTFQEFFTKFVVLYLFLYAVAKLELFHFSFWYCIGYMLWCIASNAFIEI